MKSKTFRTIIHIAIIVFGVILVNVCSNFWYNLKYRPLFEKYLSERYSQSVPVSDVNWDFWKRQGDCYVSFKTNPGLSFNAYVKQQGIFGEYVFSDNYFLKLWESQVQGEVAEFASKLYDNLVSVDSQMDVVSSGDFDPFQYTQQQYYKSYKPKSMIPTYQKVKDLQALKNVYKGLDISINGDFVHTNKNIEYEKIYKVLMFLKQKDYKLDYIEFLYGKGTKSNFTAEGDNILNFSSLDLGRISTVDEFIREQERK